MKWSMFKLHGATEIVVPKENTTKGVGNKLRLKNQVNGCYNCTKCVMRFDGSYYCSRTDMDTALNEWCSMHDHFYNARGK